MVFFGIVVALIALLALLTSLAALRKTGGPSLVKKTVVVHTKDEQTIRGVLFGQYTDRWSLVDAMVLTGTHEQPLAGVQHVPTENIRFVQELMPE